MIEKIKQAESETNINPSERQKSAGNYKKGKVLINKFTIVIENPVGSTRAGRGHDGELWSNVQKHTYGYFKGTVGKDKDQVDVYLGKYAEDALNVFIIDQIDPQTNKFDEHKVMFGFKTKEDAKKAYLSNYSDGWGGFGAITEMEVEDFRAWLYDKEATSKPVQRMRFQMSYIEETEGVAVIKLHGEVIEGKTLNDLKLQCPKDFEVLVIDISSPGGSVFEGLMIMRWFNELSESGKNVVTFVTGNAYSIASMIMLAANLRIINKYAKVMVHNPMIPKLEYANAEIMEREARVMRELEKNLREIYVSFTYLKEDAIKLLMDNETFIGPIDAVEYGFAHEIVDIGKQKYFTASGDENNNKNNSMKSMTKSLNVLNRVISTISGSDFVNQLYYTTDGDEIEIYQADGSGYKTGDRTNQEEGEFKLSDGQTIKVEDYIIVPVDEPEAIEPTEPTEPVEPEVIEPEAIEPVEPLAVEPEPVEPEPVSEFNEGQEPVEPLAVEPEPVEPVTPQVAPQAAPLAPDPMDAKLAELEEKMSNKISEINKIKDEQIEALREKVAALNLSLVQVEKFLDVSAKAIDQIAGQTTSNFKPVARVTEGAAKVVSGSIFGNIMEMRGLKR